MGAHLFTILLVEDDADDALLMTRAFRRKFPDCHMLHVSNGEEAINYLNGAGKYVNRQEFPVPTIILLDLKLPRKTGFDVLQWQQENKQNRIIPTLVFSSSRRKQDVDLAYSLGAQSYFEKPMGFPSYEQLADAVQGYWRYTLTPQTQGLK